MPVTVQADASPPSNAVIPPAAGSAGVTSVYFSTLHSGQVHAVVVSLAVVIAVTVLSLGAYRLLPRAAAPQED
jgi:hypothetical protein